MDIFDESLILVSFITLYIIRVWLIIAQLKKSIEKSDLESTGEMNVNTASSETEFMKQYDYSVRISRYFLKPIGIWPVFKDASLCLKFHSILMAFISYWLILFMFMLCVLHIIVENPNVDTKMKLFGPVSFAIVSITKYTALVQKTGKIAECFQHVKTDWQNSCVAERKVMNRYAKLNRFLSVLSAFFMYSGGLFYHAIMPILSVQEFSLIIDVFSNSNGTEATRASIASLQRLWPNVRVDLVCKSLYLLQCMSGYVLDTITVGTCSLAAVFISHVCAQLQVVIMQLQHYVKGNTDPQDIPFPSHATTPKARLTAIVLRHTRALKFAVCVEECLHGICFIEFIGSTVNICLIGYYWMMEWTKQEPIGILTYFILLISFTVNIFIFCYIGELLANKCTEVGSIYHTIDWYNLPKKKAADLIFIIRISQYPIKLSAGKFVDLTLSTFTDVIKTAFAYWNLMRTVVTKLKN